MAFSDGSEATSPDQDAVDRYWTERAESEYRTAVRRRRNEHFLHQLGIFLIWAATLAFAYDVGRSADRVQSVGSVQIWVGGILLALFAGLQLACTNLHRREMPPLEKPRTPPFE